MKILGNIIWWIFGGLESAIGYFTGSLAVAVTIIGIPFALQTFKIDLYCLWPFGSTIRQSEDSNGCITVPLNILWFIFGGLWSCLMHLFFGILLCITIIGIPVGLQCFKFASLAFFPFGKEVVYGGGGFSFLVNLIWIIFFGLEMAIGFCILGCLWCITILGIPIGKQCFKMAKLSLMP